ncbi:MAG: YwaF family protein [Mycoplasmataceae bacterium]|nr:YwaF family protein [Mycoplasmataceae bacterium]
MKYIYKQKHLNDYKIKSNSSPYCLKYNNFYKYFLLSIWISLVVLQLVYMMVFAIYYHDTALWRYLSIHVCSLPMYLLPILIFSNPKTKLHQIVFNFTFITVFICAVTFVIGFATPNIFDKQWYIDDKTAVYFAYHTYIWHSLLLLLFIYLVVFRFERMYSKLNWQLFILILIVNIYIFFMAQILRVAGYDSGSIIWIEYNHDLQPIFDWCNHNPYITNTVVFFLTLAVYEGVYFAYFYIEKFIQRLYYKKHFFKIKSI